MVGTEGTGNVKTDMTSELSKFQLSREQVGEAPRQTIAQPWFPEREDIYSRPQRRVGISKTEEDGVW